MSPYYADESVTLYLGDCRDYDRLCIDCHRMFDAERRNLTGERTIPEALR